MAKQKLGILLSSPPEHKNVKTVAGLVEAALQQEVQVYLYLVDEGVKNLNQTTITPLGRKGLKVFACAYGAQRYGISVDEKAVFGGLVVLSDLIKGCDRFISFN